MTGSRISIPYPLSVSVVVFFPTVHLSLPLSSSLPASLSDEGALTPDAENAVISAILPFLFLGNERDAEDLDLLLRLNVGFVVNVTTHLPLYHLTTGLVRYKRLPATDNSKQNLQQYFEEVFEFIGRPLRRSADRLFIQGSTWTWRTLKSVPGR